MVFWNGLTNFILIFGLCIYAVKNGIFERLKEFILTFLEEFKNHIQESPLNIFRIPFPDL